jgi:hypothetical protein
MPEHIAPVRVGLSQGLGREYFVLHAPHQLQQIHRHAGAGHRANRFMQNVYCTGGLKVPTGLTSMLEVKQHVKPCQNLGLGLSRDHA